MTFLIIAIVFSTIIHLLFKVFAHFKIDLLGVIVVNYAVCIIIGYHSSTVSISQNTVILQDWFPFSILQGIIFLGCLFLLGRTTEKQGVATASLATRLSVAIPTVAAFFLYGDMITVLKISGILATLLALTLSCKGQSESTHSQGPFSMLPIALFMVFGMHSTLIKYLQERFLNDASYHAYLLSAFSASFLIGGTILVWKLIKKRQSFTWKILVSGLALGCTNYGSLYFLIKVLSVPGWQSSQLFPTVSIAVLTLSSLGAWILFHERPSLRMAGALVIGTISIILINLN